MIGDILLYLLDFITCLHVGRCRCSLTAFNKIVSVVAHLARLDRQIATIIAVMIGSYLQAPFPWDKFVALNNSKLVRLVLESAKCLVLREFLHLSHGEIFASISISVSSPRLHLASKLVHLALGTRIWMLKREPSRFVVATHHHL